MAKSIFIYNSFSSEELPPGKKVWAPLTKDINAIKNYLLANNIATSIQLEKVFKELIDDTSNLTFFERKKGEITSSKKIVLYAQSDTLSNSCYQLSKSLGYHDVLFMVPVNSTEHAHIYLEENNIQYEHYSFKRLKEFKPDVFIVLNDWTKEVHRIFAHCKYLGIKNICLQESIIDFGDKMNRMLYSDNIMIQGTQTIQDLERDHYFLTGNPRYENSRVEFNPHAPKEYALINSNFTYGIFEEERDNWIDSITEVCSNNDVGFKISQHPRDNGDLSRYQKQLIASSSVSVSEQIANSHFIATRFSSLIHEGLLQYKPVIYYNPHEEKMQYNFRFNNEFLFLCKNKDEIDQAIKTILNTSINKKSIDEYITNHCLPHHGSPSENINHLLSKGAFEQSSFGTKELIQSFAYWNPMRKILETLFRNRNR